MPYLAKTVASYYNAQKDASFCASDEDGKIAEFTTKKECAEYCAELNGEIVHLTHNQAAQSKYVPFWVSADKNKRPFWAQ
jgi:hypothetical protein